MARRVLNRSLNAPKIGRRNVEAFDPNAIDADGDGKVQDATRFERPASPRISGAVSGRQMTPEMVERDKEIIRRRNEGQQAQQIADDMNISLPTVNYALYRGRKRGEVTYIDTSNKPQPKRDEEIIKRFIAGETQRSIANDLGMNPATVATVINTARRRGQSIPFREAAKKRPKKNSREQAPTIYELVEQLNNDGKSVKEIAKELNVKERDVVQALVQNRINSAARNRQRRAISGAIRRPEPEVWEKPIPNRRDLFSIANRDDNDALYDEATGPRKPNRSIRDLTPVTERSQDILVDIAQELLYAKSKNKPGDSASTQKPTRRKSRRNEKLLASRVTGLSSEERAQYISDRNDLIREELIKGELSFEEIAEIFGLKPSTVEGKFPKEVSVNRKLKKSQRINEATDDSVANSILEDIEKGFNTARLSEKYGLSLGTINKRFGKEIKERKERLYEEIREEIQNGATSTEIINKYGVSRGVVRKIAGDIIRERGDANDAKEREINRTRAVVREATQKREIKNRNKPITGSASTGSRKNKPKKSILDYLESPDLEVSSEDVAKSIGVFDGWYKEDGSDYDVAEQFGNLVNHPQFDYDLQTGKPVKILGSRVDDNIEQILQDGTYRTDRIGGTYGPGANIAFDGDPFISEVYSEKLGWAESREDVENDKRLILEVNLKNPIVYDVGMKNINRENLSADWDENIPSENRVLSRDETMQVLFDALGGDDKEIQNLAKSIVEKKLLDKEIDKELQQFVKDLASGKRKFTDSSDSPIYPAFGYIAREKGHDGIIRLALGVPEADTSHMVVFEPKSIKVIGSRPSYSKETVDAWDRKNNLRLESRRATFESLGYTYNESTGQWEPGENSLEELRTRARAKLESRKISGSVSSRAKRSATKKVKPKKINLDSISKPGDERPLSTQITENATGISGSPVVTAGLMAGSLQNDNFNAGEKIKSSLSLLSTDNESFGNLSIKYGDLDAEVLVPLDSYRRYSQAYSRWSEIENNFAIKNASATIMGEPLPRSSGFSGNSDGTHYHDILNTGISKQANDEQKNKALESIADAFVMLNEINTGRETNEYPIYAGLSNLPDWDELLRPTDGMIVTLPLSSFSPDRKIANMYTSKDDARAVILEIEPGAKVSSATGGIEFAHKFDVMDDNGNKTGEKTAVTESITAGKFKFLGFSTILVPKEEGGSRSIKKIRLEQIETFDPISSSFKKNTGRLSGSMSSPREAFISRVGDVRPITNGLIPTTVESLRERALEYYTSHNPILIQRLARINRDDSWKSLPDAVNPDGTPMTKEQYIASQINAERQRGEEFASSRLNKYDPDMNPHHLRQLQHNVDIMFAASPELQMLCDTYGYPLFAIFKNVNVRDKDGKPVYVPARDAIEKNMDGASKGTTLMALGISAIQPSQGDDSFIPVGVSPKEALNNTRRLFYGTWGVPAENYDFFNNGSPLDLHNLLIDNHMSEYKGRRPDILEAKTPLGVLRHETSHAIHSAAVAQALLAQLENPSEENRERHALLSLLMKPSWQAAFASSAGKSGMIQLMYTDSVSDYAASAPPEWLAETLMASLSPNKSVRGLLNFNHRAILAMAFPELRPYIVEGDWP